MAEGGVIGVQEIYEFTNVARRKLNRQWARIKAVFVVIEELLDQAANHRYSCAGYRAGARSQAVV